MEHGEEESKLVDICKSMQLPPALCNDIERVFMTVHCLADTDDSGLQQGTAMLEEKVSPMALLAIRNRCRSFFEASLGSGAVTDMNSGGDDANAQASGADDAKEKKPRGRLKRAHEAEQENHAAKKPFPKQSFVNEHTLLGSGFDLLQQDVLDGLDWVAECGTDSSGDAKLEYLICVCRYSGHHHGERHKFALTADQHGTLLAAMAMYLLSTHEVNVSACDMSLLPNKLKEFWNQLRNKGNGAAYFSLPPKFANDMHHIQYVLPPVYSSAYQKHTKKTNILDGQLYTYVLGKIDKRRQVEEQQQENQADEPPSEKEPQEENQENQGVPHPTHSAHPALDDSLLMRAMLQKKGTAEVANVMATAGATTAIPAQVATPAEEEEATPFETATPAEVANTLAGMAAPAQVATPAEVATPQVATPAEVADAIDTGKSATVPSNTKSASKRQRSVSFVCDDVQNTQQLRMAPGQRHLREMGGTAASKANDIQSKTAVNVQVDRSQPALSAAPPSFCRWACMRPVSINL